jgi:hypothetical protein
MTIAGQTFTVSQSGSTTCTFAISPSSQNYYASGGAGSVAVTASLSTCNWTAVSNNPEIITITSGFSGTGNGTVTYSVATNNTNGNVIGTLTIAGQTFTVNQAGPGCTYSISPTNASFQSSGGTGSVSVNNFGGCPWVAVSNASWITITSGASGAGAGTVNYSVGSNSSTSLRSGTMTIGQQTFTVNQQGVGSGCTFTLTPPAQNFIKDGGTASVTVATQAGCNWTALPSNSWITITSGAAGTGNGSVGYSVAANTGPQRSGSINIGGQTLSITQDSGCVFTINPTSASFTTSGGAGSFSITTNDQSCGWLAVTSFGWITINAPASGLGNGTVNYTVAANTGGARTGSIAVAGQTFTINQDGAPGGCQVYTFAGTGTAGYGEASGGASKWNAPAGAVIGKSPSTTGNPNALFIADANNNRIRMVLIEGASAGTSSLIAGNGTAGYSEGAGNPLNAMYNHPKGITAINNAQGVVTTLLIADTDNHVIRKLAWSGSTWTPSLYSGKGGVAGYVDGTGGSSGSSRYNAPQAISAASSTLIFVADTGNGKIRKLDGTGASTTQTAAGISSPVGVTVNLSSTNLIYVSDQSLHKVFQVNTTTSAVTLLAGNGTAGFADGTGTAVQFNSPRQLAWTSGDVLYIADSNNFRVRKLVAGTQVVTTLAGTGAQGNADGACTTAATFKGPQAVAAFGPSGELYVVDTADNKIRKVVP